MTILSLLLLINAVLHGVIIFRFGFKGNEPPALFGIIYAALALAVFLGVTYSVPGTLIVTSVGLLGLALNFKKLQHDTIFEKIIFVIGAAIIVSSVYLIFV